MGAQHWANHALKPKPLKIQDLGDGTHLVIRERIRSVSAKPGGRYVASVVYDTPPVKGKLLVRFAYGATPDQAEMLVLASGVTR